MQPNFFVFFENIILAEMKIIKKTRLYIGCLYTLFDDQIRAFG